jgi:hypothetical protein
MISREAIHCSNSELECRNTCPRAGASSFFHSCPRALLAVHFGLLTDAMGQEINPGGMLG